MKRIISIILSITLFCTTIILIYSSSFKYFTKKYNVKDYLDKISYFDKANFELTEPNYFIQALNNNYLNLIDMGFSHQDILNLEKETDFSIVIGNIIYDKVNHVLNKSNYEIVYSKRELDKVLISKISNDKLKQYIINHDYVLLQFEQVLNKKIQGNTTLFRIFTFFLSKKFIIIITSIFLMITLIIFKIESLKSLFKIYAYSNISQIILALFFVFFLDNKFKNTTFNYIFLDYVTKYVNFIILLSIILLIIDIIVLTSLDRKNVKIKPRIRKVEKYEEDFGFGL